MICETSPLAKPLPDVPGPCETDDPSLMPVGYLEMRICELAGHITAATCQYLLLLADFDDRRGWAALGLPSCAAWLSWKCQVSPGTAREHVRVARALKELPLIREEFAAGRFSYAKVRALTRIATPDTEYILADMAACMTAAQLERFAQAVRKCTRDEDASRRQARRLTWRFNDDGSLSFSGTLPPEDGAVLLQAIRAATSDLDHPHDGETRAQQLARHDAENGIDLSATEPSRDEAAHRVAATDLADALTTICGSYLEGMAATADNPDVYQVVIHAGATAITEDAPEAVGVSAETPTAPATTKPAHWPVTHPAREDRCHLEDGPSLSAATLQLIGCNATISTMLHDADGSVLAVGRRSRKPPDALRRAVRERDRYRCRFPGCESRRTDLHHIQYWSNGGPTSRDNLLSLCRRHHRLVHDKAIIITATGEFHTSDGTSIPASPPLPRPDGDITTAHKAAIAWHTIIPPYSGERLNLDYAVWVCLVNIEAKARQQQERAMAQAA